MHEKSRPGPRSKSTHSGRNRQRSFDPPTPTPRPEKGVPRYGGYRGQNRKIPWGIIFSPKMMILQRVEHPVPYLGVPYANDPKKGGIWRTHLRLI